MLVLVESLHKGVVFSEGPLIIPYLRLVGQAIMQLIRVYCDRRIGQVILFTEDRFQLLIGMQLWALAMTSISEEVWVLAFSGDRVAVDVLHYASAETV